MNPETREFQHLTSLPCCDTALDRLENWILAMGDYMRDAGKSWMLLSVSQKKKKKVFFICSACLVPLTGQ